MRWIVLFVRVAAEPPRHRVAVWRELRRAGALPLGQGAWAVPAIPAFSTGVDRVVELAQRGDGEVLALEATGRNDADSARLQALFTQAREGEWAEFLADCAKYEAELEEEQSLERLRRWHRELKLRDLFGAPSAAEAEQRLKHCSRRLEDYTERVFQALRQL